MTNAALADALLEFVALGLDALAAEPRISRIEIASRYDKDEWTGNFMPILPEVLFHGPHADENLDGIRAVRRLERRADDFLRLIPTLGADEHRTPEILRLALSREPDRTSGRLELRIVNPFERDQDAVYARGVTCRATQGHLGTITPYLEMRQLYFDGLTAHQMLELARAAQTRATVSLRTAAAIIALKTADEPDAAPSLVLRNADLARARIAVDEASPPLQIGVDWRLDIRGGLETLRLS